MAHIDAGKNTTTERILYYTGINHKIARCTTAQPPWTGWNRNRSAASPSPLRDHVLERQPAQYHRTPGHVDFTVEVDAQRRVLTRSRLLDGKEGVEPQSEQEKAAGQVNTMSSRICFVNKMDKIGALYFGLHDGGVGLANAVPIQLPVGAEADSKASSTWWEMNAKVAAETKLGETYDTVEIPAIHELRSTIMWFVRRAPVEKHRR